jgi:hypothetical protein
MNDARRYRMRDYRDLTLATAASWRSLARQQAGMDELLANWSEDRATTSTASNRQQHPPDLERLSLARATS